MLIDNSYLVNKLYSLIGVQNTLKLLAIEKPNGSIKEELKQRQESIAAHLLAGQKMPDVLQQMVDELVAIYNNKRLKAAA